MGPWGWGGLTWFPCPSQRLHPAPSGARSPEKVHLPAGLTASLVSGTPAELSWDQRVHTLRDPHPSLTFGLALGSPGIQPLTRTSWAQLVSRSRRILPGPTGRSVWGGAWGPGSRLPAPSVSLTRMVWAASGLYGPRSLGTRAGTRPDTPLPAASVQCYLLPAPHPQAGADPGGGGRLGTEGDEPRPPGPPHWPAPQVVTPRCVGVSPAPAGTWLLAELRGWQAPCGQELSRVGPTE